MLHESFEEPSLRRTDVELYSPFKASRVSLEDDERSGRSSTNKTMESVENILELIHKDRRRIIHELADTVGLGYGVCQ
jgi:hypothetical protein